MPSIPTALYMVAMNLPHRSGAALNRAGRSSPSARLYRNNSVRLKSRPKLPNLAATGQSPVDLLSELHFVDADDAIQCRKSDAVVALTTPGGRVIHMCGKRFIRPALSLTVGEIVLSHELQQRTRTRREPTDRLEHHACRHESVWVAG
jgi:hypothetical protein